MIRARQYFAPLRTCTQCEWIFKGTEENNTCPRCDSPSVSARARYGSAAYTYAKNQHPWKKLKVQAYKEVLERKIKEFTINQS